MSFTIIDVVPPKNRVELYEEMGLWTRKERSLKMEMIIEFFDFSQSGSLYLGSAGLIFVLSDFFTIK